MRTKEEASSESFGMIGLGFLYELRQGNESGLTLWLTRLIVIFMMTDTFSRGVEVLSSNNKKIV